MHGELLTQFKKNKYLLNLTSPYSTHRKWYNIKNFVCTLTPFFNNLSEENERH